MLSKVSNTLLTPSALTVDSALALLNDASSRAIDYGDLYFQYARTEGWSLEDGIVKAGSFNIDTGVGVRMVSGEKTAFAYSDEISRDAIRAAVKTTAEIAQSGSSVVGRADVATGSSLYVSNDVLGDYGNELKIRLLQKIEKAAKLIDPRVIQVMASLSGVYENVLIIRMDGRVASDIRPLVRLSLQVIVEQNGRREQGSSGGGGRFSYEYFDDDKINEYARTAVEQALVNLDSVSAPAGEMTVVLGAGWPGVLLHEAIGHGLEGDFNRKGSSAFTGMIGERVAASGVTVVDDGTLEDRRGSLSVDDEGNPTQSTVLIEDGVLRGYMQDSLNARLMNAELTGNGRRESYAHVPMPRMTNTYMLNGKHDHEEIIGSVKKGLYAANFGGGQVDIVSGKFVFSASEAYLIENGKVTQPVKGATLIGNGPDVLTRVSMIGNDLELDSGVGTCGKDGQSVPVGVGQPTLRVDGLTVGGTDL